MPTKILMVLDGSYRFDAPAAVADFTFTALVAALTDAGMEVTRAHRGTDATAHISDFNFATSLDLAEFDALWLIGWHGRNAFPGSTASSGSNRLEPAELAAIARFMDAGGGVFATGDHDSIGADLCGRIPRVRAMRAWYGDGDGDSPMPGGFPRNFPVISAGRADTVRKNPQGDYDIDNDGADDGFIWFENQSDSIPQPIIPTSSPAHPILRHGGADILVCPDHMHEGNTLGEVAGYDYGLTLDFAGQGFVEFPVIDGHRELPTVIATGQSVAQSSRFAENGAVIDAATATPKTVNTLSAYDGRVAGVGRAVTGSTFHHYIDINLTGSSDIVTAEQKARTGPDAEKGQGFGYPGAEATFGAIKAMFVNIAHWLARPRPALGLILERSTFSQDEVTVNPQFEAAILVTVDGLKPDQFPAGGITTLTPTAAQLASWAPALAFDPATGITHTPTGIASDDPLLPPRLQRFTFTYRVTLSAAAFGFAEELRNVRVEATLAPPALAEPLQDAAWLLLVKSANPFMLDLAGGNTTPWLSSDLRAFPVVAGESRFGVTLPNNATRAQALTFIRQVVAAMDAADFDSLSTDQTDSALSPFATTTTGNRNVYNFAIARVRLNGQAAVASNVRLFFRIFSSQTTAALTYREVAGAPIDGYRRTAGASPIALPGLNSAGSEWLSFPCFAATRAGTPESQSDPDNVKTISPSPAGEVTTLFGALIDNNLSDPYLRPSPLSGAAPVALSALLMGEHQCLVAQIEYAGTPIPSGANPATSDKLAQRNLALSAIANPGLDASRSALHTFEIEASPPPPGPTVPPDELLLQWRAAPPEGTEVRIVIPGWQAAEVVALADRLYPRHALRAVDAHTVALPGGGVRYVPIPPNPRRQTGILIADFPLGVRKGQRFDLAVRQVTNRGRTGATRPPKLRTLDREETDKLLAGLKGGNDRKRPTARQGVVDLGGNRTLITDLSVLDGFGDHAVLVEQPSAAEVAAARRASADWRETIGAFQLGIPVSVKADMLLHHMRLLSVLRWRAEWLRSDNRWYATMRRYVELIADKVRALGGDPFAVPATPDGKIPQLDAGGGTPSDEIGDGEGAPAAEEPWLEPGPDDWLGESGGLDAPAAAGARVRSGKVSGLLFDHFGDFEGFTLEGYAGTHQRYFSREPAVLELARTAWTQRLVVTVFTVSAHSREVRRLLLRGYRV